MSLQGVHLGTRRDRQGVAVVLALLLVIAGIVVNVWRPLAPALPDVQTPLDAFSPAVRDTIAAYRDPAVTAALLRMALSLLVPLAFVATRSGRRAVDRLAGRAAHSPARAALVGVVIAMVASLATLPLSIWIGYVHNGRFGFRTAGPWLWARDWIVGEALIWLVVGVGAAVFVAYVRRHPRGWPWRLTVWGTLVAGVLVLAYPLVVQPLFMATRPLGPGPVRDEVEHVLAAAGEPGLEILVGDASRRTTRVNAFVVGIGPSRRVVLYDNLLTLPPDQVGLVVAHELAHREHRDIPRGTALTAVGLLPALLVLRRLWTSAGTGRLLRTRGPTDPRLVAVALVFVAVAQILGQPFSMYVSRRAEAAADWRALQVTDHPAALVRTTRIFTVRDLSMPDPPGWAVALWGSHPTIDQRIRMAVLYAREHGIGLPDLATVRADEADLRNAAVSR